MLVCSFYNRLLLFIYSVMCDDEATVREISSDEARLLIDGLKPNHVCSVRARALIAISNSAVAFTNFSDEAIFTTCELCCFTFPITGSSCTLNNLRSDLLASYHKLLSQCISITSIQSNRDNFHAELFPRTQSNHREA